MDSVGDLARALVLRTNQVRLRNEMDQLAVEVSTGLVKDPARHLGGDVSGLVALDRSLARLDAFRVNAAEARLISDAMQQSLGMVQTRSTNLASSLLSAELTPTPAMTANLSSDAVSTLNQMIGNLNQSAAGRFLFSGTATNTPPLVDGDTLLTAVRTELTGLTDPVDIQAELDLFFAPGGTFDTSIYTGSTTGLAPLQVGETDTVSIDIKASDQTVRDLLKPLVAAAIAADQSMVLDVDDQVTLLRDAGIAIMGVQEHLTSMRAGLGSAQARIEGASTHNAAERTATSMAKLDLIGADPYETASRYESVRMQLEGLYAITARSQRLSLTGFL